MWYSSFADTDLEKRKKESIVNKYQQQSAGPQKEASNTGKNAGGAQKPYVGKAALPHFKYHPDPLGTGSLREAEPPEVCECCGQETAIVYDGPFYAVHRPKCLCPGCIASGRAAETFHGEFQDSESVDAGISDPAMLDELTQRTPGYAGIQQEYWRVHCKEPCAFLGYVGWQELCQLGLVDEVLDDPTLQREWDDLREMLQSLENGGWTQGYLFRCLHCGRHLLWVDCD